MPRRGSRRPPTTTDSKRPFTKFQSRIPWKLCIIQLWTSPDRKYRCGRGMEKDHALTTSFFLRGIGGALPVARRGGWARSGREGRSRFGRRVRHSLLAPGPFLGRHARSASPRQPDCREGHRPGRCVSRSSAFSWKTRFSSPTTSTPTPVHWSWRNSKRLVKEGRIEIAEWAAIFQGLPDGEVHCATWPSANGTRGTFSGRPAGGPPGRSAGLHAAVSANLSQSRDAFA